MWCVATSPGQGVYTEAEAVVMFMCQWAITISSEEQRSFVAVKILDQLQSEFIRSFISPDFGKLS